VVKITLVIAFATMVIFLFIVIVMKVWMVFTVLMMQMTVHRTHVVMVVLVTMLSLDLAISHAVVRLVGWGPSAIYPLMSVTIPIAVMKVALVLRYLSFVIIHAAVFPVHLASIFVLDAQLDALHR
jgi:hypothetical protein